MSTTTHLLDQRHALIDLRAARDVLTDHHLSTAEVDACIDALARSSVQIAVRCRSCRARLLVQEPVDGTSLPQPVLCADCDTEDTEDTNEAPMKPLYPQDVLVPSQVRRHLTVVPLQQH